MITTEFTVQFNENHYDLKNFLRDHPGGVNTLLKYKGRPIKQVMKSFDHSASAYHMLSDFKVATDSNLTGELSGNGRIITKGEADRDDKEIAFLEDLESRLDWSKPMLAQLECIAPHYQVWVNSAVYRKCRMFASPLMEAMTYTPWYLVPMVWIPIILYLGQWQYFEHVKCDACSMTTVQFVCQLVYGVVMWTVLEYSLHRWVFHFDPGSSVMLIRLHFLIHGIHHKVPFDGLRQVFPPVAAMLLGVVLYTPLHFTLSYPLMKFTGACIGYLTYDLIHFYVHHGSPRDGTYLYAMKRYHSNHHFLNHDKAFGITSKVWDHIFRTFVNVRKLGFSLQW